MRMREGTEGDRETERQSGERERQRESEREGEGEREREKRRKKESLGECVWHCGLGGEAGTENNTRGGHIHPRLGLGQVKTRTTTNIGPLRERGVCVCV